MGRLRLLLGDLGDATQNAVDVLGGDGVGRGEDPGERAGMPPRNHRRMQGAVQGQGLRPHVADGGVRHRLFPLPVPFHRLLADFHHSDAPDAEGRFRDLSPKDLAAWLIKTRKKDLKKISGSLTQQVVFNRNDDPKYADKMEKTRIEVYKQLGRDDLLDKKD